MEQDFIVKLYEGYQQRKYDIDKKKIEKFIDDFFYFIFFLEENRYTTKEEVEDRIGYFKGKFLEILNSVLQCEEECRAKSEYFFSKFSEVYQLLQKDLESIFQNDPAAKSIEEVTYSYPGFYAISIYRFAHLLYQEKIPIIPRMWTEFAHSKTGIDIHPAASIGAYFFIDHGTGIVIGETVSIGNRVKIFQGVTFGALSVSKEVANIKRHPTIEDNVVIYANATILGGDTVIGENSLIGGNVWITESIAPNSIVIHKEQVRVKNKSIKNEPIHFII